MYMYIRIHTFTQYIYPYIYIYAHACVYMHTSTCTHIHTYLCVCICSAGHSCTTISGLTTKYTLGPSTKTPGKWLAPKVQQSICSFPLWLSAVVDIWPCTHVHTIRSTKALSPDIFFQTCYGEVMRVQKGPKNLSENKLFISLALHNFRKANLLPLSGSSERVACCSQSNAHFSTLALYKELY